LPLAQQGGGVGTARGLAAAAGRKPEGGGQSEQRERTGDHGASGVYGPGRYTSATVTDQPTSAVEIGAVTGAPAMVGTVLLALGDSIAAGIGASHVSSGCMAVLASALRPRDPGLALVNLAIPGESSHSMLLPGGQLDRAEEVIAEVARGGGRVGPVALCVGGNDIMEAKLLGDEEALRLFGRNLGAILGRLDAALRATGSSLAEVGCVQTVYNPFEPDVVEGGNNGAEAHSMPPRRA